MYTVVVTRFRKVSRLAGALALLTLPVAAQTPSLTTLLSFPGGADGEYPSAGVIFGANGGLFGTTSYGGNQGCGGQGCGIVFELKPGTPWTQSVLYTFHGGADGGVPTASLTRGSGGVFYGTTFAGGATGNGTVFEIAPSKVQGDSWTEKVLYSFAAGVAIGTVNVSGTSVTLVSGTPFVTGTAWNGVAVNIAGSTFTIASVASSTSLTLTEPVVNAQTGVSYGVDAAPPGPWAGWPDGSGPLGSVMLLANGNIYGTTSAGGSAGAGAVFELVPPAGGTGPWTETVIYSFQAGKTGTKDGANPQSGLVATKGNLYGTTCCGAAGGSVYRLSPGKNGTWTETPLIAFANYAQGDGPIGALAISSAGVVYGTTKAGGKNGGGIVFSLTPPTASGKPYTLTTIHAFTGGLDGGAPYGNTLLAPNGALYVTVTAGCEYGVGGVIEFTPPAGGTGAWTEDILYSFTGGSDGSQPVAGVIEGTDKDFYGTTNLGGTGNYGTVFELVP